MTLWQRAMIREQVGRIFTTQPLASTTRPLLSLSCLRSASHQLRNLFVTAGMTPHPLQSVAFASLIPLLPLVQPLSQSCVRLQTVYPFPNPFAGLTLDRVPNARSSFRVTVSVKTWQ